MPALRGANPCWPRPAARHAQIDARRAEGMALAIGEMPCNADDLACPCVEANWLVERRSHALLGLRGDSERGTDECERGEQANPAHVLVIRLSSGMGSASVTRGVGDRRIRTFDDDAARGRLRERGDLVAWVLEQAGEDLLERSLAVGEPHRACGRHDVQLLITELLDRRERVSRRGETGEQDPELDVGGVVDLAVLPRLVLLAVVFVRGEKSGDSVVVVSGVCGDGPDGAVAELLAATAGLGESLLARI